MSATPPTQQGTTKAAKPSLGGVAIKQRKRTAAASAKHEPTAFRDEILRNLNAIPNSSSEDVYLRTLESLASTGEVDIRKYDVQLLELLILGRLLAPGGNLIINDGSEPLAFSVFHRTQGQGIKGVVDVLSKYIRRFKYLQRPLEETVLPGILQYVNKLDALPASLTVPANAASAPPSGATTPVSGSTAVSNLLGSADLPRPNLERLALATALMVSSGLVPPTIVQSVRKDHLIKDGSALFFVASYVRSFLALESGGGAENTILSLRKGGSNDLLAFFPPSRRSVSELQKELGKDKLGKGGEKVVDWQLKVQESVKKDELLAKLREMLGATEEDGHQSERSSDSDIIAYLGQAQKTSSANADDFVALITTGLLTGLSVPGDSGNISAEQLLPHIKSISGILESFASNPRSEIAVINALQLHSYNHPHLLPIALFPRVLQTLYNEDTLSSQAIFYWHEKGAKAQGKENYRKAVDPLVNAIRQSEDSDEEEEE